MTAGIGSLRDHVTYHLISGETELLDTSRYPFGRDELPISCVFLTEKKEAHSAYISGGRSLVFPMGDRWFKAKAIGIPTGVARPLFYDGKIFSFYLSNASIGSGEVIWGFSSVEEARNGVHWMRKVKEAGIPASDPIGIGIYRDVYVLDFVDRLELFNYVKEVDVKELIKKDVNKFRRMPAACMFIEEPTDVRADEILRLFVLPNIDKVLEMDACTDYLRWLGSSCAYNLRLHHDKGITHGTSESGGPNDPNLIAMTNSHVSNHLVGEEQTWTTDYNMTGKANELVKKRELYFLSYIRNPLKSAPEIGSARFMPKEDYSFLESVIDPQSFEQTCKWFLDYLQHTSDLPPQERLTMAFMDGLEQGYCQKEVFHVDPKVKREMWRNAVTLSKNSQFQTKAKRDKITRSFNKIRTKLGI